MEIQRDFLEQFSAINSVIENSSDPLCCNIIVTKNVESSDDENLH